MSSVTSIERPVSAKAWKTLTHDQLSINIAINGGYRERRNTIPTFSNMDKIQGQVVITAQHDTRFSNVKIAFVGVSNTSSDAFVSSPFMSPGCDVVHKFLKLEQPIGHSTLPTPRIMKARHSYTLPFTFVVPAQLLPNACQYCEDGHVRVAHLQVPPSLGDNSFLRCDGKLQDDLASKMARISYSITVAITREHETSGNDVTLAEASKKVRVEPAVDEQPPLALKSTGAKTIRKGFTMKRLGKLVMEAWQPGSLRLHCASLQGLSPPTTSATVTLRFNPAGNTFLPPKLGRLNFKLQVTTFYSTTARHRLASYERFPLDTTQVPYSQVVPLSSRSMADVKWIKHTPAASEIDPPPYYPSVSHDEWCDIGRCCNDQASKDDGIHKPSATFSTERPYYTTDLLVPIQLPSDKVFVPTFHSCFISRLYRLYISLSLSATVSLTVKVPIQVTAGGHIQRAESVTTADFHVMQNEADMAPDDVMISASLNSGMFDTSHLLHGVESAIDAPPDYGAISR